MDMKRRGFFAALAAAVGLCARIGNAEPNGNVEHDSLQMILGCSCGTAISFPIADLPHRPEGSELGLSCIPDKDCPVWTPREHWITQDGHFLRKAYGRS